MATTTTPLQEAEARYAPLRLAVERRRAEFMHARTVARAARATLRQAGEEAEEARSHLEALRADSEVRAIVGNELPDLIAAAEVQVATAEIAFAKAQQERVALQQESTTGRGLSSAFEVIGGNTDLSRVEHARNLYPAAAAAEQYAQTALDESRGRLNELSAGLEARLRRQRENANRAAFEAGSQSTRTAERSALRDFFRKLAA